MNNGRRYTIKDLQDAKRLGIREGIEQAQSVVLDVDRHLLDNMDLNVQLGKSAAAEHYRELHEIVCAVYQDLIVLGEKR